mgnify:FL=1
MTTLTTTTTTTHANGNGKAAVLDYDEFNVPPAPEPPTNGAAGKALRKHFELIPAGDLDKLPPIKHLDAGREIPEQSLTLAYGPSGAGKSFWALDRSIRIAQHSPVIYVAAEGGRGFAARLIAWRKHFGQDLGHLYFIGEAVNMIDPGEVAEFIATISPHKPVLVVLDTLARCMAGGDENSAQTMGLFVASCDRVREATGAAVLPVHHTGKQGTTERGSSALRAAADQVISLENNDDLIKVSCEKSKDSREFQSYGMRLVVIDTGRQLEDGEQETSCVILPSDQVMISPSAIITKNQRKVLEALALDVFGQAGAKGAQIQRITELAEKTMYRALSSLKRGEYVHQDDKGDPYNITERGRRVLDTALGL